MGIETDVSDHRLLVRLGWRRLDKSKKPNLGGWAFCLIWCRLQGSQSALQPAWNLRFFFNNIKSTNKNTNKFWNVGRLDPFQNREKLLTIVHAACALLPKSSSLHCFNYITERSRHKVAWRTFANAKCSKVRLAALNFGFLLAAQVIGE